MKQISSSFLRSVHHKAGRLEERFGIELSKGIIPEGLELEQLINWDAHMSSGASSLAVRKAWFMEKGDFLIHVSQKHADENDQLTGWIVHFNKILTAFFNRDQQFTSPPFIQEDHPVPFEELLIPWVEYASAAAFDSCKLFVFHAQQELSRDLLKWLSQLSAACFLHDFEKFQQSPDMGASEKYPQFIAEMYGGRALGFWESYAALARMLVEAVAQWRKGTALLIKRLEEDQQTIAAHFFEKDKLGIVNRVESNLGSRHTADGQVQILHFEGGKRIVYRPRSAAPDQALTQIISWVNTRGVSFDLLSASTLDRDRYSWQAYIPHEACMDEAGVKAFYRRQGQLAGLLYTLGSTDYHFGNLQARGAWPILIDNETLFSPVLRVQENASLSGDIFLDDAITDSLAHSHFLIDSGRLFFPNAPSIIGVFEQEERYPIDLFTAINTDSMALHQVRKIRKGQNVAKVKEQPTDPYRFVSLIKEGFSEMMDMIRSNARPFHQKVKQATGNFQLEIRLLLRSSVYYHTILTRSLAPALCRNGIDRSIHFERIVPFYLHSPAKSEARLLMNTEKAFLESHLLPWFHVQMDQEHIAVHSAENERRSIIQKSAKTLFEHRLAQVQHPATTERNKRLLDHYYPSDMSKRKEGWGEEEILANLYFCYDHFFSSSSQKNTPNPFTSYFLENGIIGLILTFSAWYRVKGNLLFKSLGMRLLEPLKAGMDGRAGFSIQEEISVGAIAGLGSIVNALCLIGTYLDEKMPIDLAEKVWQYAKNIKTDDLSFHTGLSGLLYAGLRLRMTRASKELDDFLSESLAKIVDTAMNEPVKKPGLGRGTAGLLYVACLATGSLRNNAYKKDIEACANQLRKGVEISCNDSDLSFHDGLSGWVLADVACRQMGLKSILPVSRKEAIRQLSQWAPQEPDHFASGISGRLEALMLLEAAPSANFSIWKEMWTDKMQAAGKYQLSPSYLNPFFYRGISGIIYQQVRLAYPTVISSVWGPFS